MSKSAEEIQTWLKDRVGELTGLAPGEIKEDEPLLRLGLDSVGVVTLASDLEKWTGYRFRENPLEQYPTIQALADYLAAEMAAKGQGLS